MMMRRRPLLRAAAIGGGAYALGRHQGRNAKPVINRIMNKSTDFGPASPAAGACAPDTAFSDQSLDQLNKLGEMHKSGVLTDQEFEAAKAKILAEGDHHPN